LLTLRCAQLQRRRGLVAVLSLPLAVLAVHLHPLDGRAVHGCVRRALGERRGEEGALRGDRFSPAGAGFVPAAPHSTRPPSPSWEAKLAAAAPLAGCHSLAREGPYAMASWIQWIYYGSIMSRYESLQQFLTLCWCAARFNAPRGHTPRGWAALPRGIMGSFTGRTAVLSPSVASETAPRGPFRLERARIDVLRRQRADSSLI
jgi:hypothetical protein